MDFGYRERQRERDKRSGRVLRTRQGVQLILTFPSPSGRRQCLGCLPEASREGTEGKTTDLPVTTYPQTSRLSTPSSHPTSITDLNTLSEVLSPTCSWATWKQGLPQTIAADCKDDLPPNMRFHEEKRLDFEWTLKAG